MTGLEPLGDRAFLAHFPSVDEATAWAEAVRVAALAGVVDIVTAYGVVAVFADPERADLEELQRTLDSIRPASYNRPPPREHVVPVRYDGEDLVEVAGRLGLHPDVVVDQHSSAVYTVQAMGFLPGFPYAAPLPEGLAGLERRASPRVRVPRGSVAIVGGQTGIYPQESPGGWHLLGRTPLRIADVPSGAFPIRVGDRIRFRPIDQREFDSQFGALLNNPSGGEPWT
jgi:KipI family sensor histidine kinase inhibitor